MTRRRLLLIACPFVACAVVLGVVAMRPPRPGVTSANFHRIENGMTVEEVDAILGPDRFRPTPEIKEFLKGDGFTGKLLWGKKDRPGIEVGFEAGKSAYKRWHDPFNETLPDKIRRWLHLPYSNTFQTARMRLRPKLRSKAVFARVVRRILARLAIVGGGRRAPAKVVR